MVQPEGKRKTRSDKKIRVNAGLNSGTHNKLRRLALACSISKTELAAHIVEIALNTPGFINAIQDHYGADDFRVIPVKENGVVFLN